jgi:GntR family transcriptional regulator
MYLTISVDPRDATPIWKQIEERVRRLVASRVLPRGSPVPSVRDLARELRINPATVVRAYQKLTDDGVLAVRRGEGTFVADSPPAMGKSEKIRLLREGAMRYVSLAATTGATEAEIVGEVEVACQSMRGAPRGAGK